MKLQIANNFDQELAKLYSSKVTVNLDDNSQINPKEFWNTMELIATSHKAMINFKISR